MPFLGCSSMMSFHYDESEILVGHVVADRGILIRTQSSQVLTYAATSCMSLGHQYLGAALDQVMVFVRPGVSFSQRGWKGRRHIYLLEGICLRCHNTPWKGRGLAGTPTILQSQASQDETGNGSADMDYPSNNKRFRTWADGRIGQT